MTDPEAVCREIHRDLAKAINERIEELGWKKKDAAASTGVSEPHLRRLRRIDRPDDVRGVTVGLLCRIAAGLDLRLVVRLEKRSKKSAPV